MEPFIIEVRETTHLTGVRVRELTSWALEELKSGGYRALGRVVTDNGVTLDFLRFTETSPIKRREGRTLITESGSRYTLLKPLEGEDPESYTVIPE
jgi:hypothetical protein